MTVHALDQPLRACYAISQILPMGCNPTFLWGQD